MYRIKSIVANDGPASSATAAAAAAAAPASPSSPPPPPPGGETQGRPGRHNGRVDAAGVGDGDDGPGATSGECGGDAASSSSGAEEEEEEEDAFTGVFPCVSAAWFVGPGIGAGIADGPSSSS